MMIKFDSGIGVWHTCCFLHSSDFPKEDKRLFQTQFLPAVHFVNLIKKSLTPAHFDVNQSLHYYYKHSEITDLLNSSRL